MTDRPIIFSAPMVQAILDGRKTQTRRVLAPQPEPWRDFHLEGGCQHTDWSFETGTCTDDGKMHHFGLWMHSAFHESRFQPLRFSPGDRLFPAMAIPSLNRNYCADVYGRIWSRARDGTTWEVLKGARTSKGYLSVTPAHDGRYQTRLIHRLVAEAFYGFEPNGFKQVRHLSGDQHDNAPDNLDWGTQEDNWSDRLAHGRSSGARHHAARLTEEQVAEIRISGATQRSLALRFGVAQSTIWAIRSGRFWQDNPQPAPPNFPRWASRITLHVTDVRVDRLQSISEEDARAEGVYPEPVRVFDTPHTPPLREARPAFAKLWNSINGRRPGAAWQDNPWVAAIAFRPVLANIDAPEAQAA